MVKRGNKLFIEKFENSRAETNYSNFSIKNTAVFEIFLLVSLSFAIAFILSDNLVNAGGPLVYGKYGRPPPGFTESGLGSPPTPLEVPADSTSFFGKIFTKGTPTKANLGITDVPMPSFFTAHLIEGVVWGGIVALGIKFLGPMLGMDEKQADAAALAAFGGIAVGKEN